MYYQQIEFKADCFVMQMYAETGFRFNIFGTSKAEDQLRFRALLVPLLLMVKSHLIALITSSFTHYSEMNF